MIVDNNFELLLSQALGEPTSVEHVADVGGGCIARSQVATIKGGQRLFVKTMSVASSVTSVLRCERNGLMEIATAGAVHTSRTLGWATDLSTEMLVMEYIDSTSPTPHFWKRFGEQLAQMHAWKRESAGKPDYGFREDNFIGRTSQFNSPLVTMPQSMQSMPGASQPNWPEFFSRNRLKPQIDLLIQNRGSSAQLVRDTQALIGRLDRYLPAEPAASLLHGDLWNGNFLAMRPASGSDDEPIAVIFDPAVYYGDREAEFAMTELFGGFPAAFYDAYNATWPLQRDWKQRVEIYKLYHLLNHVNLFGVSYIPQCEAILRRFV